MAKVNCVILNYNDAGTAAALVRLIRNYDYLYQIVVVDNASTDDSYEQLRLLAAESAESPQSAESPGNAERPERPQNPLHQRSAKNHNKVVILKAERNGGYGAGNNLGVRYSIEVSGADYVLIANPDISVSDSCIRSMTSALDKFPDVGVVAAAMIDPQFKNKPNAWRLHSFWGELFSMGPLSRRLFRRFLEYPKSFFMGKSYVDVDVVHGSMLMVNGAAFLACGGFDENMFLYQEEAVLGCRMRAGGYRTVLLTKVFYHHQHSASICKTYRSQAARQRLRHASTMYYLKHYLKINRFRETIAKVWFAGIMTEIFLFNLLHRSLPAKKPSKES